MKIVVSISTYRIVRRSAQGDGVLEIPYPEHATEDEVEVFTSLLGDGLGQAVNEYKFGYYDGACNCTHNAGCNMKPTVLVVLLSSLTALMKVI